MTPGRKVASITSDHGACIRDVVVIEVSVAATSLTCEIGIEDQWRDADGSGRPSEEIAHFISQFVQIVGYVGVWVDEFLREDLVQQDEVVSWTRCVYERILELQEEVPAAGFGAAFVDDARGTLYLATLRHPEACSKDKDKTWGNFGKWKHAHCIETLVL